MPLAVCLIRPQPSYRREAFIAGLRKGGWSVRDSGTPADAGDVLVIWNRYGANESLADDWEDRGGTVIVTENGYIGSDAEGRQYYAISKHGHNGSGSFAIGEPGRYAKTVGMEVKPWRVRDDGYTLICGQRGIGSKTMASPPQWELRAEKMLRAAQEPTKIRQHPGRNPAVIPLDRDLAGAKACAIWSSSVGVRALVEGIPVSFDAPHWICSEGAARFGDDLLLDDGARMNALETMAWGQWSVSEIETGEPFIRIRDLT